MLTHTACAPQCFTLRPSQLSRPLHRWCLCFCSRFPPHTWSCSHFFPSPVHLTLSSFLSSGMAERKGDTTEGLGNWGSSRPIEQWEGVTVDADGRVKLQLPRKGLTCKVPSAQTQYSRFPHSQRSQTTLTPSTWSSTWSRATPWSLAWRCFARAEPPSPTAWNVSARPPCSRPARVGFLWSCC